MYLMYVDESGDDGFKKYSSRFYILSGMVVNEARWKECSSMIYEFKRGLKERYGIKIREELHAVELTQNNKYLPDIKKSEKLSIFRTFLKVISRMPDVCIINVVVDKKDKPDSLDVFVTAWATLVQRFENTLANKNFPGSNSVGNKGIIITDETDILKLKKIIRKMRHHNWIPNTEWYPPGARNLILHHIVEDPFFKPSHDTFMIQAADIVAYSLHQHLDPSEYMKIKRAYNYFNFLDPVLCKVACTMNPFGIVKI